MKLSIGRKLGLSFTAIIALMAVSSAVVYTKLQLMKGAIDEVVDKATPTVRACDRLLNGVNQSLADLRGFQLTGSDPQQAAYYKSERAESWKQVDVSLGDLRRFADEWKEGQDRELVGEVERLSAALREVQQQVEDICHTDDNVPAIKLFRDTLLPEAERIVKLIAVILDANAEGNGSAEDRELITAMAHARSSFALGLVEIRGFINTGKEGFHDKAVAHWASCDEMFQRVAELESLLNPQQKKAWERLQLSRSRYLRLSQEMYSLRKAEDWNKAGYLVQTEGIPKARRLKDVLGQLTVAVTERKTALHENMNASVNAASMMLLVATIVAVLLGAGIAYVVSRKMVAMVRALSVQAEAIAKGDLRIEGVKLKSSDEVGQLAEGFDTMLANLKDLTGQVLSVTENVNSTATQISSSASQQAASTKQQASTVQEITSTMQEISQTGAQILDRAKELSAANEASTQASQSGIAAVQETSRTMEAIREQVEEVAQNIVALSEKTQAIGDIVATVNEVAEQSNLLALNATIEAASAGEQGNRFSVVANEMKNLADQAKQCTVQVRDILGEIQKGINSSVMLTEEAVKRVESGKKRTEVTEETIRQISQTTDDSVQAFQQIIGVTNQQQIGFQQVTQGMEEIREAAQQTASGTSQLEQAVGSLSGLSSQLKTAVGSYQV